MMFVGNSPQHSGNVCRLFDEDTCKVMVFRDVKFINKFYYRSDMSRAALVPHQNDIVLNRMQLPPTPQWGKAGNATIAEVAREDDGNDDGNDDGTDNE